jgi:hypothetical protein
VYIERINSTLRNGKLKSEHLPFPNPYLLYPDPFQGVRNKELTAQMRRFTASLQLT